MLDRMAIARRFFLRYAGMSKADMARLFQVKPPTVTEWEKEGTVPWSKLKYLSDSQAVRWDWILEGREPQESVKQPTIPGSIRPSFDTMGINQRFLSLFADMTQTQIADTLDVTQGAVSGWNTGYSQVPWRILADAVRIHGIRWDWLIDGFEPQYRR